MAESGARPIIIKRPTKKGGDSHHGGAWKVAYADFVTAMMAFFLLLWLLSTTTDAQRKGLADFFDPTVPVSRTSAGGVGMLEGETMFVPERMAGSHPRGIRPRPTEEERQEPLGKDVASPDEPRDVAAPVQAGSPEAAAAAAAEAAAQAAADAALMDNLEETLRAAAAADPEGTLADHLFLRVTPEGLVIELVDIADEPLFPAGSARPSPILEQLMGIVIPVLAMTENPVALSGHTDASPLRRAGGYTNWELSADRANTARRLALAAGLPEARLARVSGHAATQPLFDDPYAAQNRRISLTLLREGPR